MSTILRLLEQSLSFTLSTLIMPTHTQIMSIITTITITTTMTIMAMITIKVQ